MFFCIAEKKPSANQLPSSVGVADQITWVAAGMLVSLGAQWENPLEVIYMASISGSE